MGLIPLDRLTIEDFRLLIFDFEEGARWLHIGSGWDVPLGDVLDAEAEIRIFFSKNQSCGMMQ